MNVCRILIVENESIVAMDMAEMLTQLGYNVLPTAIGYSEAVGCLDKECPDIVLVDITLGGPKSGIDLAHLIREQYNLPFIFITSHSDKDTVSLAAATKPNGFLVKPFDAADLFTSIEVALSGYEYNSLNHKNNGNGFRINDSIFIRTDKSFTKVMINEINWIESGHNYLYIITDKAKFVIRSNFRDFLLNFPSEQFTQVHKSFIVNRDKIDSFSNSEVRINGKEMPLSRSFKEDFFSKMNKLM